MVIKQCQVCGKDIIVKDSHARRGWGKYCSKKCQRKTQLKGKWVKCDHCGKSIWRRPKDFKKSKSKKFFCSRSCHCSWENKNNRCGEKAPNWITGHAAYRDILKRHGQLEVCMRCGLDDKRVLVVHHRDKNRKNNSPENLEWLCSNCHVIVHLN